MYVSVMDYPIVVQWFGVMTKCEVKWYFSVKMPHVSSGSGGDDLGSTDEVKVFKDEGDGEDEKRSSENLTEEKSSLIDLTESEVQAFEINTITTTRTYNYTTI